MNRPTISVITPTYNASATVERALLSVARQSYGPVEHLIIDGCSTDDTLAIVERYRAVFPHIRVVSEKDDGVYDAMNKGIDMCRSDWVYFLGADDLLFSDMVFTELHQEGHLARDRVFYGDVLVEGDTSWAKDGTRYDGPFDLEKLFRQNICHQAIFYPAGVIRKAGYFDKKYFIAADWEYNIRCAAAGEFVYIDKIIARFTGGGTSSAGGIDGIGNDIPGIVAKYFHLDLNDPSLRDENSPFRLVAQRLVPQAPAKSWGNWR